MFRKHDISVPWQAAPEGSIDIAGLGPFGTQEVINNVASIQQLPCMQFWWPHTNRARFYNEGQKHEAEQDAISAGQGHRRVRHTTVAKLQACHTEALRAALLMPLWCSLSHPSVPVLCRSALVLSHASRV